MYKTLHSIIISLVQLKIMSTYVLLHHKIRFLIDVNYFLFNLYYFISSLVTSHYYQKNNLAYMMILIDRRYMRHVHVRWEGISIKKSCTDTHTQDQKQQSHGFISSIVEMKWNIKKKNIFF